MSAYIEKEKLLEWLYGKDEDLVGWLLDEIESGRFDWVGESE
jgi:hypothetical protein